MKTVCSSKNMKKEDIKNWLKENLSEEKYIHSLGVEECAVELAQRFNLNTEKASIAGLLHDCAKCLPNEELVRIVKDNKLDVNEFDIMSLKPLHAPVGRFLAQVRFGITDEEILNAIHYHTIGRLNMSMFEKIVFLADKIEARTRNKDYRNSILKILDETNNIDNALIVCFESTLISLAQRRLIINPRTIDVWNDLIQKQNQN